MRLALALLIVTLTAPAASAEWTVDATTATWHHTAPLVRVEEARDAMLWERDRRALLGAVVTASLGDLAVVDNENGTGTLRIAMPRAAGGFGADAWVLSWSAAQCPEATTNPDRLACVDAAIKADLRQVIYRYRQWLREQSAPVVEPDFGREAP